jgi:hypothetical protein
MADSSSDEGSEKDCMLFCYTAQLLAAKDQPMPGAYYCLAVLSLINVLNYTDRYIPSATKELVIEEFKLTDAQSGLGN